MSDYLQLPEPTYTTLGKYFGRRHFGKGVEGKVDHFRKKGWKGLEHLAGTGGGFTTKGKDGVVERLEFANKAISEASSDDFLQQHEISDEAFSEYIDGGQSNMIEFIKYAPSRMLMLVKFVNKGSVVLYDHVPAEVFAELAYIRQSDGSLGAKFWDVVRIHTRGNFVREGSKYPYQTLERGYEPLPTGPDGRKYDPNRQGSEYKTVTVDDKTGEITRETSSERVDRIATELQGKRQEGRLAAEDKRLQDALRYTAEEKARRQQPTKKPTSYLGFRQNFLEPDEEELLKKYGLEED